MNKINRVLEENLRGRLAYMAFGEKGSSMARRGDVASFSANTRVLWSLKF